MNLKNLLNPLINPLLNPLSKHIHLVIIALYAYVLLCHVNETDYVSMVILTAATCLSICYLKKKKVGPNNLSNQACSDCGKVEGFSTKEGLDNKKDIAPESDIAPGSDVIRQLPNSMGQFDGLCLQTGNKENWMKSPDNTALIPNDSLFSYLSSQGPLKPVFSDNSALFGPPIDGQKGSAKKMFMFANNRSSPNCCPSTYSTSTGCICTTENQRNFIASRGNQGPINLQDI
jgi:hypothetical protein